MPKFCRTRGCNLAFGHDERCVGPNRDPLSLRPVDPSTRSHRRDAVRKQAAAGRSARGVTTEQSRERMTRMREHKPQRFVVTNDGAG